MKIYNNVLAKLVLPLLVCFFFCCCNYPNKSLDRCSDVSKNYYLYLNKAKDTIEARVIIQKLKKLLSKEAHCTEAKLLLADIDHFTKKYEEAKNYYLQVVESQFSNVYALFKVGMIYNYEKKYDSVIVFFRDAAKYKVKDGFYIDYNKDIGNVTEGPVLDIEYDEIIFNNAIASYYAINLVDAMREFNYCISKNKKLDYSFLFRGLIYFKIKNFEKGCKDMLSSKEHGNLEAVRYIEQYCVKGNR